MCRVGVSRKLWKTISFLWTGGQWGLEAVSVICVAVLWEAKEQSRGGKWETSPYADALSTFSSLLREINGPKRDGGGGATKTKVLTRLCLWLHLGHIFCHGLCLSCQWQMTPIRLSPGTRSPQAKLFQDPVHLLPSRTVQTATRGSHNILLQNPSFYFPLWRTVCLFCFDFSLSVVWSRSLACVG